ncbi:hypothetical protein AGOR_G00221530 [Albula goreensis]|uniref:Uncharacterized protein n=1 Tax=Albula goreensis TaxID=1534307 RepID=A0A8T3CHC7_9TELE|nr:hypothetical protein AGOR_G00221530 [Albula goreensis]
MPPGPEQTRVIPDTTGAVGKTGQYQPLQRHSHSPVKPSAPWGRRGLAWAGAGYLTREGGMAELNQSSSSLQRKKPPWLKLDIPKTQVSLDDPPTFVQARVKRQAFLRSVSMPVESTRIQAPPFDPRRPALQRQSSITQTIKR